MKEFLFETKNELWNSKEELLEYYNKDDNFMKLKRERSWRKSNIQI